MDKVQWMLQTFLNQALRDGFFHADMHPGNLFVDKEGRLCAVDFGIMGRLSPEMRRFMAETLGGFLTRDYRRVAQVHFDVGFVPKTHNVETFAQALRSIGEPVVGLRARDVSMARLLEQLFDTTRRFDMQAQPQLVLLQKSMLLAEGVGRNLAPEVNMWELARPLIEDWMRKRLGPEGRVTDIARDAIATVQKLPRIIERVDSITADLARNGLKLHPDTTKTLRGDGKRKVPVMLWLPWVVAAALLAVVLLR